MSTKTATQQRAFYFLRDKFYSQEIFSAKNFQDGTGFGTASFKTYMSKHFRGLLIPIGNGNYRVSAVFRQFSTWSKFRDKVVSQKRDFGRQYTQLCVDNVVIFEFYMPLRNEEYLRQTLDSLFYKDTIEFRFELIDPIVLESEFPRISAETKTQYLDRIALLVANKFGGYSIHHVSGRFRAGDLMTQAQGKNAERYLVDETTAVVRFILPCQSEGGKSIDQVAHSTRWLFQQLFVRSILEVVNAEDEIWLLESGMQHQLHIWRAQD
jgi:hypothetical protein